jgi:ketosteroid isomerase-like protein
MPNTHEEITAIAHTCFKSYVDKDRPAIEALISEDFHFTSPLDNRIDRQTYFERCWPNSVNMAAVDFKHVVVKDEKAFVVYECRMNDGKRFRNTELWTVKHGKVADVEVYFGWSLPHQAPVGKFVAARTDGSPSTN